MVDASLAVAALQGAALQQAAAANRALYLRNPLAQALAVRNLQNLNVQNQLAALGQPQQLNFITPALAAQMQSQGLLLGAAQLPQTTQPLQQSYDPATLLTEQARLQLVAAQGMSSYLPLGRLWKRMNNFVDIDLNEFNFLWINFCTFLISSICLLIIYLTM